MLEVVTQLMNPVQPWQRIRYARDVGSAIAINLIQVTVVVLIVRGVLGFLERMV